MKTVESTLIFSNWLKESVLEGDGSDSFTGEYQHGYYNGIEAVMAYIEERPELFRNKDKKAFKTDVDRFPEHFL